jgi:drug/metabolite transporter (DMT)-like permease
MNLRLILWTIIMAYVGFIWTGQGTQSLNGNTITGALLGAALGFCLAFIFNRRAQRKHTRASAAR